MNVETNANKLRFQVEKILEKHPDGLLPIVHTGDPVLRTVSQKYDGQFDDLLAPLLEAMRKTMLHAPGVGLAAPQIGLGVAIAVMHDLGHPGDIRERTRLDHQTLINPVYKPLDTQMRSFYEGCLSVPGYQGVVSRYYRIELRCENEKGKSISDVYTGWPARIVQHETDHLNGMLYLDKAHIRSLATDENMATRWADASAVAAAGVALGFGDTPNKDQSLKQS